VLFGDGVTLAGWDGTLFGPSFWAILNIIVISYMAFMVIIMMFVRSLGVQSRKGDGTDPSTASPEDPL